MQHTSNTHGSHGARALSEAVQKPFKCPCCGGETHKPTGDLVVDVRGLSPQQSRIFLAVWRGRGAPVVTARLIDAMYADDPDGGPCAAAAYKHFKTQLCLLRQKLKGSGVGIETVPRRGYRLKIGE